MIFLAVRHLFARKKQTIFTISGIFLGTTAFILISGMLLGFREYLLNELIHQDAHVHIRAREEFLQEHSLDSYFNPSKKDHFSWNPGPSGRISSESIDNPQKWYHILQNDPRVSHYAPQCNAEVTLSYGKSEVAAPLIGCDPDKQKWVMPISSYVTSGKFEDLAWGNNGIVLGYQVQKKIGAKVGQIVMVATPKGNSTPFKVVAIFKKNNPMYDYCCYGLLSNVQKIKEQPNSITEIGVKLHDHALSASLATSWSFLGREKIESWDQINANLFELFALQDAIRYLSVGAVLVVAAFGIYNVLNMTVMQKRKDIAILRSMGYSRRDIIFLFFSQGFILGGVGSALGLFLGYFLGLYLETIPFGGGPFEMGPGHLLISQNINIYIQAVFLGLFSASIASLLPAISAGKLSPIEIIRGGAE